MVRKAETEVEVKVKGGPSTPLMVTNDWIDGILEYGNIGMMAL